MQDKSASSLLKRFCSSATSRSLTLSICTLVLLGFHYVCIGTGAMSVLRCCLKSGCTTFDSVLRSSIDGASQRIVLLDEVIADAVRLPDNTRTQCCIHASMSPKKTR
jgi:hypothetical protein